MQRRKSPRHQKAANARWSRDPSIEERPAIEDRRTPIALDLRPAGGPNLTLEPRYGYVAWRARDEDTGEVLHVAAMKELLHRLADDLPRMLSPRSCG